MRCAADRFSRPQSIQGFTLIELLVATAVLALLLVLVLQITNHTLSTTHGVSQQLDSTQAGRRVLDALASDVANAVISSESTVLCKPANSGSPAPTLAMITAGRGPSTEAAVPRFLSIKYQLVSNQIVRGYSSVPWAPVGLLTSAIADPTGKSILANGVLQLAVFAKLEDGSVVAMGSLSPSAGIVGNGSTAYFPKADVFLGQLVPEGWTALVIATPPKPSPLTQGNARVLSLLVALAVVDEQNLELLRSSGHLDMFAQPSTADPISEWEAALSQVSDVPGPSRAAIRFLSKTITVR